MPWIYSEPRIKICITCNNEFETRDARKRRCDDCVKKALMKKRETKSKNVCSHCGRRLSGVRSGKAPFKERICEFCRRRLGLKRLNGNFGRLESIKSANGVTLCPNCGNELRRKHGRWECLNDDCPVISFDWRGVHKNCALTKEVVLA